MNYQSAVKTTKPELESELKQVATLLGSHPDNPSLLRWQQCLKRWLGRCKSAIAEGRKKGYSAEFEQFWSMYGARTGSKAEAYGVWQKEVVNAGVDTEVVIAAVKPYKADCKKLDQTLAHARTWLSQRRWESYEGVKVKVQQKRMCGICKASPALTQISYWLVDNGQKYSFGANVCGDCQSHNGEYYIKAEKKWSQHLDRPEKKGKDATTVPASSSPQEPASGSLSEVSKISPEDIQRIQSFRDKYSSSTKMGAKNGA